MNTVTREKLLKIALVAIGLIFFLIYPLGLVWPFGLDLARRSRHVLSADDLRDLRGFRRLSDRRGAEPLRKSEPDLLHHLVERRACRNYGSAGDQRRT